MTPPLCLFYAFGFLEHPVYFVHTGGEVITSPYMDEKQSIHLSQQLTGLVDIDLDLGLQFLQGIKLMSEG